MTSGWHDIVNRIIDCYRLREHTIPFDRCHVCEYRALAMLKVDCELSQASSLNDEVVFRQAVQEAVIGTEPCPNNSILEPPDGGSVSSSGLSSLWNSKNW